MKDYINNYFKETWEDVEPDIDFSKLQPIRVENGTHISCLEYVVDNEIYRLLYSDGSEEPLIQKLKNIKY